MGLRGTPLRRLAAVGALLAATSILTGCALFGGEAHADSGPGATPHSTSSKPKPHTTPGTGVITGSPTPSPTPTTPPPPPPTVTPVPAGTVVAQGSVASPKGSIHYRYRVVSTGDNFYSVEFSNFTSTVPVPVSATFEEVAPQVGDGVTYHGIGDHLLGGPTTRARADLVGTAGVEALLPDRAGDLLVRRVRGRPPGGTRPEQGARREHGVVVDPGASVECPPGRRRPAPRCAGRGDRHDGGRRARPVRGGARRHHRPRGRTLRDPA